MARPDAAAARAPWPAPTDHKECGVPAAKPVPWFRSAPRAIISRRLPIAVAEVADPSSVPWVNSPWSQSSRRQFVPRGRPRKNTGSCELLHKTAGRPSLNLRHGPEDLPATVRSAPHRHRHRLRLDRGRGLGSLDRADLSHPDLIRRRDRGEPRHRPGNGYPRCGKRFSRSDRVRAPASPPQDTVKRNVSQQFGFPSGLCVNRA